MIKQSNTTPLLNNSLIDIGINLTHKRFASDIEAVISRAKSAGISCMIVTGTDLESSELATQLCQQHPQYLYHTVGFHPHDAKHLNTASLQQLKLLAGHSNVVAIGETGLDFNRNFSTPEQQIRAFEHQIEIAIELQKPLFLHERDAHTKQIEILKYYRNSISDAVIHCFTGNKKACFSYLDLDLHIGVTGWICDNKRGLELRELVGDIPCNRLMIETDAPYLTPKIMPKLTLAVKGRNEPCMLAHVAQMIAQSSAKDIEQIAFETTQTAQQFFKLPNAV